MMMEMPMDNMMACMAKMDEFCMAMSCDAGWCETMMPFYQHCSGYSMKMMNDCSMPMEKMECCM
jgi:hypothetical protein